METTGSGVTGRVEEISGKKQNKTQNCESGDLRRWTDWLNIRTLILVMAKVLNEQQRSSSNVPNKIK